MPTVKGIRLTTAKVTEFQLPKGKTQGFLWDSVTPGLAVRASAGAKAYIFQCRLVGTGKTVRITIGACNMWSLHEARQEARRLQTLADRGIDPRKERADKKAEEVKESLMVSTVWKEYLKYKKGEWSDVHHSDHEYLAREQEGTKEAGSLYPLLQMRMADIDANVLVKWAEDTVSLHNQKLKEAKAQRKQAKIEADALEADAKNLVKRAEKTKDIKKARKLTRESNDIFKSAESLRRKRFSNIKGNNTALLHGYRRFRAFWNWALQREEYTDLAPATIFSHSDLKRLLPTSKPKVDVLEKGHLAAWFEAVRAIDNRVISAYLQVLLLTGARRNELAMLKWSDVESRWNSMFIRDKVEGTRKVPLTPYVKFLIDSLPRFNDFVFSSPKAKSGYLQEPRKAHDRALALAGLPSALSLHGLRRSFKSLSEWVEMPVGIVAQIMGHKPSATAEKHYTVRPVDLLAIWHTKLEQWILDNAAVHFNHEAVKEGLQVVK